MTKGLVFSQRVLLKLVEKGMSRDEAYEIVQRKALECWESGGDFKREIGELLAPEDIEEVFSTKRYLEHVDEIFERLNSEQ